MTPLTWFPGAKRFTLDTLHATPGTLAQRNSVVLHCTEGTTASGAINTFVTSKRKEDGGYGLTSAHFVIDRDGTIWQLAPLEFNTWHASMVNMHSVGIETVAMSQAGADALNKEYAAQIAAGKQKAWTYMGATEEQYASLKLLVHSVCVALNLPIDRSHVRTHNEASPRDGHVLCCTGALDPDKVVADAAAFTWPS